VNAVIHDNSAAPPVMDLKRRHKIIKQVTRQLQVKAIRPSSTQLYLVRTMLELLVEKGEKSSLKGRQLARNDIKAEHVLIIENFLKSSFFWTDLMDLTGTVQACCDLSQLWYREFYLEMTKGERIQFPIEMSLPWILMSHLLDSKDTYLIQHILYPLDLYNDSASCALHRFQKQFLYDEIEAEVKLCFEQLIYKVSEQIYEYYRTMASLIHLTSHFGRIVHDSKFEHSANVQLITFI
jgi:cytoplasmic FMR1 interacting protein